MILFDTHYLIWAMTEPEKLSSKARIVMQDSEELLFFSAASIWEIELKKQIGKIRLSDSFLECLNESGFMELPIHSIHTTIIKTLPDLHKDPFDRLLLAQAIHEKWTLVTADAALLKYQSYYKNIIQL